MKLQKINWGGVRGVGLGIFCENFFIFFLGGGGGGRGGGGGVRVDVNEELKFL